MVLSPLIHRSEEEEEGQGEQREPGADRDANGPPVGRVFVAHLRAARNQRSTHKNRGTQTSPRATSHRHEERHGEAEIGGEG